MSSDNCEHFVKWALGIAVSSTQIKAGAGGAVVGFGLVKALSDSPSPVKYLGGAILVGGLAVYLAKALEKPTIANNL
jgi:hypothetical protein